MSRPLLLASLLLVPGAAHAQDQDVAEIVVTGHGLAEGLGEDVYDVLTIDRERLSDSASNRLEDILHDVPGFQNFRRSDARSANPTSQGATLRAIGGNASSRALLVLDGVPQTDPFGGWIFWPAYDPRRLGSVRVVRGGGGGANGPGALTGTIELSSAGPNDEVRGATVEAAYGSRESVDAFASFGAALGEGFATASASYARGDGFTPVIESQRGPVDQPAPYSQASVAIRGVAPLTENIELQANGLWFSDERERGTDFTDITANGTDASLRLVGNGRWRWSLLGYVQIRQFTNSFASVNAARTTVTRASEQYNVPATGLGARFEVRPPLGDGFELRLGGDWRRTDGETKEHFNYVAGNPTRKRKAGGQSETVGSFAEAAYETGTVTITGGGRIDHWQIEDGFLDEKVMATGAILNDIHYADRSGWEESGRAGVAWRPVGAVTVRSAGYIGWRLPTLNELYRPFRVGIDATAANAALVPERLEGIEAGADYRPLSNARIGATLFVNRLKNAIANVTLGQGPGVFPGVGFVAAGGQYSQRQNLDAIIARGIELDASLDVGRFSLSAGYVHVDSEMRADDAAATLDGRRPAQTPRDSASATLAWRGSIAQASLTARYIGAQFEDDLGTERLPDAVTFDATVSVPVSGRFSVELRGENLANQRVVAGISGAGIVERATPRTLWVGVRLGG
jgi:outer membrane receptor protein involved in Fe transport